MILFPDFNKTAIFSTDFQKILKYKTHENPSSRSQVVQCWWTDMTQLIVAFCNFANMPKNHKDPWSETDETRDITKKYLKFLMPLTLLCRKLWINVMGSN